MLDQLIQLFVKNIKSAEIIRQPTIRLDQFIKDVNFGSQLKAGVLSKGVTNSHAQDIDYWYLGQSFFEQRSPNTGEQIAPMLLIPLFKIKDQQGQYVNYSTFERCNINKLTTTSGIYYIGYRILFSKPLIKSVKLSLNNKKIINLREPLCMHKSGYIILRDPNSSAAMLYCGLFIDFELFNSPDCELGELFKDIVLKDKYYSKEAFMDKIGDPEKIEIDIEFDPSEIITPIDFTLRNNDIKSSFKEYTLNLNRPLGNHFNIKFLGHLENEELYFRIIKDTGIGEHEEIFMTMA